MRKTFTRNTTPREVFAMADAAKRADTIGRAVRWVVCACWLVVVAVVAIPMAAGIVGDLWGALAVAAFGVWIAKHIAPSGPSLASELDTLDD